MNDGSGHRTHSAKMEAISSAENTPIIPKFIPPICPIGPKVWDIIEKGLYRTSIVRALYFTQNKESRFSSKVAPPSDVGGLFKRPLTCVRCK